MASISKGNRFSPPERFCKYIHRYCNQVRLEGFDYCIRHILEDKSAPFKQCTYVNPPNKKRCTNAAPKSDKNEKKGNILCPFHCKRAMLKIKIAPPKKKPVKSPATFLKSLEHYCKAPNHDQFYKRDYAAFNRNDVSCEGGGGPTSLSDVESNFNDGDSFETQVRVDSVDDDFCWRENYGKSLDNAGVYTHKEVLKIAQEKMLHLQQLYCEELKVIHHQLRENRRRCLVSLNNLNEEDVTGNESSQLPSDKTGKAIFRALSKYHRPSGIEKVLSHRAQMKRLNADKPILVKKTCAYETSGVKCSEEVLVLSKFCKRHILSDPKQLLFKACSFGKNTECEQPILIFEEDSACDLHLHRLLKSKINNPVKSCPSELDSKSVSTEPEPFHSMDDIASLGLDAITPGSLFGLDQYGELGESTDTVLSEEQTDILQIQEIAVIPPPDILCDSRKSD